jgi:predicted RNase H-like HicB family nuclease
VGVGTELNVGAVLPAKASTPEESDMIELHYSLVIEATTEPDFFAFYSPELEGFTGIGHSIEDCLYQAKWGMREHLALLTEQGLPVPPRNRSPQVIIQNTEECWERGKKCCQNQNLQNDRIDRIETLTYSENSKMSFNSDSDKQLHGIPTQARGNEEFSPY